MRAFCKYGFLICFLASHALCVHAVSLIVKSASDAYVELGGQATFQVVVVNESEEPVSDIDFAFIVNKVKSADIHVDLPQPLETYGMAYTLALSISADDETGCVAKQVSITKVNGAKNQSADNKADFTHFTLTQLEEGRVVMEEYTGLWCGFCPKGEAAVNRMSDEFGHRFIALAIHSDDVLDNADYRSAALMPSGYPKASLQRKLNEIDPYLGTAEGYTEICPIRHDVESLLEVPAEAAVELAPEWNDDMRMEIRPNAKVTFRFNSTKARYAVGYVLIEDSMSGTGKNWAQANYYYHDEDYARRFQGDEYMDEFLYPEESVVYNGTYYIPDYISRRVVISAWGIQRGLANSIPQQVDADAELTFDHVLQAISSKVQNKDRLSVAVLLFNTNNGAIVNAAVAPVGGSSASNIDVSNKADDLREVARFSIGGQRLSGKARGLTLIRMNDGSVRKVIER